MNYIPQRNAAVRRASAIDFQFRPSEYRDPLNVCQSVLTTGDVEIARIIFDSAGQDVISVRASWRDSTIHYEVCDEYQRTFRFTPTTSKKPLTLRQLVSLIDTCELVEDEGRGLVRYFLDSLVVPKGNRAHQRRLLRHFINVHSEFYPSLHDHYEQQIEHWTETGRSGSVE